MATGAPNATAAKPTVPTIIIRRQRLVPVFMSQPPAFMLLWGQTWQVVPSGDTGIEFRNGQKGPTLSQSPRRTDQYGMWPTDRTNPEHVSSPTAAGQFAAKGLEVLCGSLFDEFAGGV